MIDKEKQEVTMQDAAFPGFKAKIIGLSCLHSFRYSRWSSETCNPAELSAYELAEQTSM